MRKMDIDDPSWSPHEMDEENFEKLTDSFANAFSDIYEKLEELRKDLPAEIESNIELVKEQMARIKQLEKEDPHHTKCDGDLVPETRYKCKKCGRSLLKT
jgi:tRNA(Ile2) C34 agmatinyltransferase TiaS